MNATEVSKKLSVVLVVIAILLLSGIFGKVPWDIVCERMTAVVMFYLPAQATIDVVKEVKKK